MQWLDSREGHRSGLVELRTVDIANSEQGGRSVNPILELGILSSLLQGSAPS